MYSWDELEYKANYIHFISNKITEQQMQIVSAVIDKLEEPVYNTEQGSKKDPDHCRNTMIINLSQCFGR